MSSTNIPIPTKLLLFGRAAGRCEYRGCNKELTRDDLTRRTGNLSAFAHIVADEPGGPRGDKILSPALSKEIGNLMLLCLDHHRLIDDDAQVAAHPVTLLIEMKVEHEARIARVAAIDGQHRTHLLLMEANIGERKGLVSVAQALDAVLPLYPVDDGMWIDLARLNIEDGKPVAWAVGMAEIDAQVSTVIRPAIQRGTAKNVSVFAFAPIPLLMYLGRAIGDLSSGVAYHRHRSSGDWKWKEPHPDDQPIVVERPGHGDGEHIALKLSFSGRVQQNEVVRVVPSVGDLQYEIGVTDPQTDAIRTKQQVASFVSAARALLAEIRQRHGERVTIHVFPAVPLSIAVEFGKCLLPKADPRIEVYDRTRSRYAHALTLLS
jgi:hypothetical protein